MRPYRSGTTSEINGRPTFQQANNTLFDYLHNEGDNLLFVDGHAKWRKKSSIKYKEFGADTSVAPFTSNPERTLSIGIEPEGLNGLKFNVQWPIN